MIAATKDKISKYTLELYPIIVTTFAIENVKTIIHRKLLPEAVQIRNSLWPIIQLQYIPLY